MRRVERCWFCDKYRVRFGRKRSSMRGSTACTCDPKRRCLDGACHFRASLLRRMMPW